MEAPDVKSIKVYAIVESVMKLPCADLEEFLRKNRFSGSTTISYNQGGVRTVVNKQLIPLTMEALDAAIAVTGKSTA